MSLWLLVLVVLAVVVFASGFVIGWRIGRAVIFVALIFAVIAVAYATRLAGRRGTRG